MVVAEVLTTHSVAPLLLLNPIVFLCAAGAALTGVAGLYVYSALTDPVDKEKGTNLE